jgi:hypothetical protein
MADVAGAKSGRPAVLIRRERRFAAPGRPRAHSISCCDGPLRATLTITQDTKAGLGRSL